MVKIITPHTLIVKFLAWLGLGWSQPQMRHGQYVLEGILVCDVEKTLSGINRIVLNGRHETTVADFFSQAPWHSDDIGERSRWWLLGWTLEKIAALPGAEMILDWFHRRKKCTEYTRMICRGRKARAGLLGPLLRLLWRGQVAEAIALLEEYRGLAKDEKRLDELIVYLRERTVFIPDYRERRRVRKLIGSGWAEKAHDLLVARRQKKRGMPWSAATSEGLVALRTLILNQGWDLYWQKGQVLPLAA